MIGLCAFRQPPGRQVSNPTHVSPASSPARCRQHRRPHYSLRRTSAHPSVAVSGPASISTWQGEDEFTPLEDRRDLPPLPLPALAVAKRVTLVRHGQSTWNAEGRIQGSSNMSVLTPKGLKQAQKTRDMLSGQHFDTVFHSPLARCVQTTDSIWEGRQEPRVVLPSLREVDLYAFQGLVKAEGKALFGPAYAQWQKDPAHFEISGHAPVRELWYRASLAWATILATPPEVCSILVVAHNACNQALLGTALGLPPSYFRRLEQSNAATSELHFTVTGTHLLHCNQSVVSPLRDDDAKVHSRVVLLARPDNGCDLGPCIKLLASVQVHSMMVQQGSQASNAAADAILAAFEVAGVPKPEVLHNGVLHALLRDNGAEGATTSWATSDGKCTSTGISAAAQHAWAAVRSAAADTAVAADASSSSSGVSSNAGENRRVGTLLVVSDPDVAAELTCSALGRPLRSADGHSILSMDPGGVTVMHFSGSPANPKHQAAFKCINSTAHMHAMPPHQ